MIEMPGNRYIGVGLLATHPCFDRAECALVCPAGDFTTTSASEFDRHFMRHEPTQQQAYRWLPGKTYDKLAKRRGWPDTATLVADGKN